jgi:hypothetical protein
MTQSEKTSEKDQPAHPESPAAGDDRRSPVNPADNPRPSSPEPDADAVREGQEKLDRVKPY